MTVNDITQLITSMGFPIVCCGALFWYIITIQKESTQAISNNTIVMEKILEHLSNEESEEKENGTE